MASALRNPRLGLPIVVFFLSTVAWSQLEPTLVLLGKRVHGLSDAQTGYVFAYVGFIVALVQGGFAGRMARKSGEGRMVLTGTMMLAIGLAVLPATRGWSGLLGVLALLAVGQAMVVPGLQSLISRRAAAEEQGATLGVSQGFSSLARVVGPATGGFLFGVNQAYPFILGAALVALACGLSSRMHAYGDAGN
jgi:MFS family permease